MCLRYPCFSAVEGELHAYKCVLYLTGLHRGKIDIMSHQKTNRSGGPDRVSTPGRVTEGKSTVDKHDPAFTTHKLNVFAWKDVVGESQDM
jgi:hypothetical protein